MNCRGVLIKLIIFSLSLGILPLGSYFVSEKYLWNGNSIYSAITAIVAANLVLVSYIVLSLMEDRQDQKDMAANTNAVQESKKKK
ncbi:hypothetical protein DENSPDRAFT_830988 [Dentipellis sp. KUC8613]|nr:hypothetical protein DENSPDRAFT_830988 [Dentipellis sp. KUC8613]